jgi:hypothetical protein
VVGDHAVADAPLAVRILASGFGAGQDQRAQRVCIVVVVLALQDGGEAFQAQAGVDRGPRQRDARAGRTLLVLHEHQVPDLDEPVAILVRRAGRPAANGRAVVVEDLRTGPAGTGIAHAPKIVGGGDADDPVIAEPRHLAPDLRRRIVLGVDGDQQPVLRQAELPGHQFPGIRDGKLLEVVAEAEIPQHFEERMMARGVADIVQVVVLAAGADAFLRRGGADVGTPLLPGEDVLELHHAGVGEHQGRVIARHQRRAFDHLVPVAGKVVEEGGADVVAGGHGCRALFHKRRRRRK